MRDAVLSIDTGVNLSAALFLDDSLRDLWFVSGARNDTKSVSGYASDMVGFAEAHLGGRGVSVVIETPSHRYFGKGNQSDVLRAFWQSVRLCSAFLAHPCVSAVYLMPADMWNGGRRDAAKKVLFGQLFPGWKDLPYYESKGTRRSNPHERDAALLGQWFIEARRIHIHAEVVRFPGPYKPPSEA